MSAIYDQSAMHIDSIPNDEQLLDLTSIVSSYQRVYPIQDPEEIVIPYLEMPDHRPTQANLQAPMTIRFRRHKITIPEGTVMDDTAAELKATNFITCTVLNQVHHLLGDGRFKKRYLSTIHPLTP
jgi:hypothetical protein